MAVLPEGPAPMNIVEVVPHQGHWLEIVADDGRRGFFDVRPFLASEVFQPLQNEAAFQQVSHGGYYIAWPCGADLSADTIEALWQPDIPSRCADRGKSYG